MDLPLLAAAAVQSGDRGGCSSHGRLRQRQWRQEWSDDERSRPGEHPERAALPRGKSAPRRYLSLILPIYGQKVGHTVGHV